MLNVEVAFGKKAEIMTQTSLHFYFELFLRLVMQMPVYVYILHTEMNLLCLLRLIYAQFILCDFKFIYKCFVFQRTWFFIQIL